MTHGLILGTKSWVNKINTGNRGESLAQGYSLQRAEPGQALNMISKCLKSKFCSFSSLSALPIYPGLSTSCSSAIHTSDKLVLVNSCRISDFFTRMAEDGHLVTPNDDSQIIMSNKISKEEELRS